MKVLQINTVYKKGSTGRICAGINDAVNAAGWQGMVVYGVGGVQGDKSYKTGGRLNYYYHNIMSRIFGHEGFYSKTATSKLIELIKNFSPDIIHLHNLHGHYINAEMLFDYIKDSGIKVIWTLHDCWAFTGKCVYFDLVQCNKWVKRCEKCPQLKEYPSSVFDSSKKDYEVKKRLFTEIEDLTIVTPSKWLKDLVGKSFLKEYKSLVINNGVDLNLFKMANLDEKSSLYQFKDKFVVLGVASPWSKRKGFEDFLSLAELCKNMHDIMFVMVGLSKKQISELPQNIIGIQKTDNVKELVELYSRTQVFFNPTYEDNYPTVNLEALACGAYVITYDSGGSGEMIEGFGGEVINKGDVKRAYSIIESIYKKGGKQAENKLISKLNEKACYTKYIKLYGESFDARRNN